MTDAKRNLLAKYPQRHFLTRTLTFVLTPCELRTVPHDRAMSKAARQLAYGILTARRNASRARPRKG